jgi:hypothetical protein
MTDVINHPKHYNRGIEAIVVIESWQLGYCLGNVVKYICRSGIKDPAKDIEDLKKAAWYLNRRIEQLENNHGDEARGNPAVSR